MAKLGLHGVLIGSALLFGSVASAAGDIDPKCVSKQSFSRANEPVTSGHVKVTNNCGGVVDITGYFTKDGVRYDNGTVGTRSNVNPGESYEVNYTANGSGTYEFVIAKVYLH